MSDERASTAPVDGAQTRATAETPQIAPALAPASPEGGAAVAAPSIRRRSLEGLVWTVLSTGGSQGLRFALNLLLTRLLMPEHFGAMGLVNTVMMGLNLFSDTGTYLSIVRSPRGDEPAFLDTAFSLQVVRGLVLFALTGVLAYPVAVFYDEPLLAGLLPVAGLQAVADGLRGTSLATYNRRLAVRPIVLLELVTQGVSGVVMIAWALASPSPWALVGGTVVGSAFMAVATHRLPTSIPHRFRFERDAMKELVQFGRWIFFSTALNFLGRQSDRLILGKLFTLSFFGVFAFTSNIAGLPSIVMSRVSTLVIMPAVSAIADRPRAEVASSLGRARFKPSLGLMVFLALGAGVSDFLVRLLYPESFWAAAWMLPILVLGMAANVVTVTAAPALLGIGKPAYLAAATAARFLYIAVGVPLAFMTGGPVHAVVVIACAELSVWVVVTWALEREGFPFLRQDLALFAAFALTVALVFGLRILLGLGHPWEAMILPADAPPADG